MLADDPLHWRVGLVGYGEVGRILAEDLRAQGVAVAMYDLKLETDAGAAMREHAWALEPGRRALGFDTKRSSEKLGIASATKMCRSVMIKGLEAMVIESLTIARAWGVEDQVLASLQETFPGVRWDEQGSYFFQRVIGHGRRRAEEMLEAAQTVREAGLEPWSAEGTAKRQAWIADLADRGLFGAGPGERSARRDRRHGAHRILAWPDVAARRR